MTERLLEAEVAGVGDKGLEVGVAQEVLTIGLLIAVNAAIAVNDVIAVITVITVALDVLTTVLCLS